MSKRDDEVKRVFSENLRYLMEARRISQADLSRNLKKSSSMVSEWCSGKKLPRTDTIVEIADKLGVRFSMLTSEDGRKLFEDQTRLEALSESQRLRDLLDLARGLTDRDLEILIAMAQRMADESPP